MGENHEIRESAGKPLRGSNLRFWLRWVVAIMVVALIAFGVSKGIAFHHHLQNKMRRHGCIDNLREIGLVCKMWENENGDRWPQLSDVPGEFMFDRRVIVGMGAKMSILTCPRATNTQPGDEFPGDAFYIYLGPGLETEEEALAFLDAYLDAARAGKPLPMPEFDAEAFKSIHGEDEYKRLSNMPIAFDRPKNHNYESINVVDANGNVQWREMGTTFPATKAFWDKLAEVEAEIDSIGGQAGGMESTAQTTNQ